MDVALAIFLADQQCQFNRHRHPGNFIRLDPMYLISRHTAVEMLPDGTGRQHLDRKMTELCLHGRRDRMGLPGPFSTSTHLPHSEQHLWDVVEEAFEASVRFTALMCPCCSTHLKTICDHPILTLSEPVTLHNFCTPLKYRLPADQQAAAEQVDASFPESVGSENSAITEASLHEIGAAISSGRFAAGMISPESPIDMQQLDLDARHLAAELGATGLPSKASVARLSEIAKTVHAELLAIRDEHSTSISGPDSSHRERTEAHVKRCMRCMEHYETAHLPQINKLTGLRPNGSKQYPTLKAALDHIALATANCGGRSSPMAPSAVRDTQHTAGCAV